VCPSQRRGGQCRWRGQGEVERRDAREQPVGRSRRYSAPPPHPGDLRNEAVRSSSPGSSSRSVGTLRRPLMDSSRLLPTQGHNRGERELALADQLAPCAASVPARATAGAPSRAVRLRGRGPPTCSGVAVANRRAHAGVDRGGIDDRRAARRTASRPMKGVVHLLRAPDARQRLVELAVNGSSRRWPTCR